MSQTVPKVKPLLGHRVETFQLFGLMKCETNQLDDIGQRVFFFFGRTYLDTVRVDNGIRVPELRGIKLIIILLDHIGMGIIKDFLKEHEQQERGNGFFPKKQFDKASKLFNSSI